MRKILEDPDIAGILVVHISIVLLFTAHSSGSSLAPPQRRGADHGTQTGIILPFGQGFMVRNVKLFNFDRDGTRCFMGTEVQGTCGVDCGGYHYR